MGASSERPGRATSWRSRYNSQVVERHGDIGQEGVWVGVGQAAANVEGLVIGGLGGGEVVAVSIDSQVVESVVAISGR